MSLLETINGDLKQAMLSKNEVAMRSIRAIKAAILLAQTEKGATKELDNAQEIALLQKLIKQRKDSIAIFEQQNRSDLAQKEIEEVEVISKYLPEQLSEADVKAKIEQIVAQTGAQGMKDMGKVMGMASKEMAGKADGSLIATIVKSILSA